MRAVVQRAASAQVEVEGKTIGQIDQGLVVLVGISTEDTEEDLNYITNKISKLRVFDDENGVMNLSVKDIGGEILLISQFTLYGDGRKGNRPSYQRAARAEISKPLYESMIKKLRDLDIHVETGEFGADMKVELINDGPVTILLDSERNF